MILLAGIWSDSVFSFVSGHFGADGVYEGAKKVRCGFLTYANSVNYAQALSVGAGMGR